MIPTPEPRSPEPARRITARRPLPKLLPPRRRGDTVRRERLYAILTAGLEYDVTVVSAPAGFGKSTLAVDWSGEAGLAVAWLSLDRQDTDALALLGNIAAAVQQRFPDALQEFTTRLGAGAAPAGASALVAELAATIQADVDDVFVFVIDDLHVLDESPAALEVVDALIRNVPMNLRLYILSRTWPSLTSLARLTAQRRANSVAARELVFTDDEADALLELSQVTAADRQGLIRRAEGWAAALAVLADHYDPSRHAADPEFILDQFIDQEVLERLGERHVDLLTSVAVLQAFDLEFAQALSGDAQAGVLLRDLERTNHFLTRLGGSEDEWFRVHALLREHLLGRLEREAPERLLDLRRQGAAVAHRRGMLADAMELSLDARDWGAVVRELYDQAEDLYQRGAWETLASWIDRLPQEVQDREIDLALVRARLAAKFSRRQECLARLDVLDQRRLTAEQRVRAQLYRGIALRGLGKLDDAVAACRRARIFARETLDDGHPLYAEIDLEEGNALGRSGQFDSALERLRAAADAFEAFGDNYRAAEAHDGLGITLYHLGWLAQAMAEFTAAQRRWRLLAEPQAQVATMNNMGNVQHMLGELETARDTFGGVIDRASQIGQQRYASYGREGLATVERDLGRLDQAITLYTIAIHEAQELDDTPLILAATYGLAMCYRDRGEPDRARTLLDHGLRSADQAGARLHVVRFRTGLGALLLGEGRSQDAIPMLEEAVAQARESSARRELAIGLLLLGAASYAIRRRTHAVECLAEAHEVTEALGYDQFLIAEARQVPEVIEYAAVRRVAGTYFRQLADRLRRPEAPEEVASGIFQIRAHGFGEPTVTVGGREVPDMEWRSARSKELFFYLLQRGGPRRKEEIAVDLWPDIAPRQLNSTFHTTLHRLRRAIHPQVVVQAGGGYQVNPEFDVRYDVAEFERVTRQAELAEPWSEEWLEALGQAVAIYRGPFAPSFDSEWAEAARRQYQDSYLACVLSLSASALRRGDAPEAVRMAENALEADPLSEEATYRLMEAHARRQDLDQAARAYRRLSDRMLEEVGSRPSPRLRTLYERVLSGEALDEPPDRPGAGRRR